VLVSPDGADDRVPIGEKLDDPLAMYLNDIARSRPTWRATRRDVVAPGLAPEDGLPVGFQILAPAMADDRRLYRRRRAWSALLAAWGGRS
jgi:aspartyl-tRNA(Asn)/glutamyl-tRNA(Gln) amidotransferase subunit A